MQKACTGQAPPLKPVLCVNVFGRQAYGISPWFFTCLYSDFFFPLKQHVLMHDFEKKGLHIFY